MIDDAPGFSLCKMRGRSISYQMRALPFGNLPQLKFQSDSENEIFVGPPLKRANQDPFMGNSMDE